MEYVDGPDLAVAVVTQRELFTEETTRNVFVQITRGIDYLVSYDYSYYNMYTSQVATVIPIQKE